MMRQLAFTIAALGLGAAALSAQMPPAGTGTIFVGSYSGHITSVDEATGTFAKIPLQTGSPFMVRLAPDRSRFYVLSANQERFEIVDVAQRKSVDNFTLSEGQRHVRALAFEADPKHQTVVVVSRPATKLIDRWEIGTASFVFYDLATRKVTRTVPWTIDPEPLFYSVILRFSPDGKLLYVFGNEITVFDVATMEQVDSWDLSRPDDPSLGRFDPGPWDDSADPQGMVTSLFTMSDRITHRKLLVVGRINLAAKTVETFPLGPAPTTGNVAFTMGPGGKWANVLRGEIGHHELWTIDMEQKRVTRRVEVPTRTRMQMRTSSNGLLYLYEAGRTIEVFSADASKRLHTIELDSDMMYGTFTIIPGPPAPPPRKSR